MKKKVFISYSHADENYRIELEKHLSVLKNNGYIDTWSDRKILGGESWASVIDENLLEADLILMLISADFLASNYCYHIEMNIAIKRHHEKSAIVVPIIIRHCDWSHTPFASIQSLPTNAKPVKEWIDQDEAFLNIVEGMKALLNSIVSAGEALPLMTSPAEKLAEIRKKLLTATSVYDMRKLRFEMEEYRKVHPLSFEFYELEESIHTALQYGSNIDKTMPTASAAPIKKLNNRRVPLIILGLVVFLILILMGYLLVRFI